MRFTSSNQEVVETRSILEVNPHLYAANVVVLDDGFEIGPRCINNYQMILVMSGNGMGECCDQTFDLSPGSFVLYGPGDLHHFKSDSGKRLEAVTLNFTWFKNEDLPFHSVFRDLKEMDKSSFHPRINIQSWPEYPILKHFEDGMFEKIESVLLDLARRYLSLKEHHMLLHRASFLTLLHWLNEGILRGSHSSRCQWEQQFLDHLEKHFQRQISRAEMSNWMGCGETRLGQLCLQYFGVSFSPLLLEYRLDHAKNLLLNSSRSIKEIANASGFQSSSYFIRVFQKKYGTSPTKYRFQ